MIRRSSVFLLGPLLAATSTAVSFAIVALSPLILLPEIEHACFVTGLAAANCTAGAFAAGVWTLAAFALVFVATVWAMRRLKPAASPRPIPALATKLFLALCFALVIAHVTIRELAPAYGSRIEELSRFSNFISLENLLWPLLVQLVLLEKDWRLRSAIIAALMLIMLETPYRAVSLVIFAYAFALPLAYLLWDAYRSNWPKGALRIVAARTLLVTLLGCAILSDAVVDSRIRTLTATPLARVELTTMERIRQRLAYPLYQAAIVAHLAKTTTLPTIADELARKFRLSDKPNLNEFAYNAIYPSGTTVGETTSQYYGEGAAYFGKAGLLWTLGAPLLFVAAWLLLSGSGLEAGAIMSIGLWRSSIAGLFTLLPAILLQVAGLFVMTRFRRLSGFEWFRSPALARSAGGLLLVTVAVAAAMQAWAGFHDPQRRDMLRLEFTAQEGCAFDMSAIEALPDRIDRSFALPGRTFKSLLTLHTPERVYLVLPYGEVFKERASEFVAPVSSFTKCTVAKEPAAIEISGLKVVSSLGVIPLEVMTVVVTLIAGFLFAGAATRATFLSIFSQPAI